MPSHLSFYSFASHISIFQTLIFCVLISDFVLEKDHFNIAFDFSSISWMKNISIRPGWIWGTMSIYFQIYPRSVQVVWIWSSLEMYWISSYNQYDWTFFNGRIRYRRWLMDMVSFSPAHRRRWGISNPLDSLDLISKCQSEQLQQ